MLPIHKLDNLESRHQELQELLCQPDVLSDTERYTALNKENAELSPIASAYAAFKKLQRQLAEDKEALNDPELRDLVQEEIPQLQMQLEQLEDKIQILLLPRDPYDAKNTILEIRAGTGGEEAALFAADLFRMYSRYAEKNNWKVEVMSSSAASAGGFKEIIALVSGDRVYSRLRFEGGVHRVQRVPETEAQGRVHTSTATVAVMPEAEDVDVTIDDADLEINIAASGGPGGQGVNTTNSAVQIQHKPTGIIVKCQDERSQIKNKARALKILKSRLLEIEQRAQHEAQAAERRGMVGSGERSEKIRTYNFPQNRVTDHRIGLTLHKLDATIEGDLDELFAALLSHRQAELLQQVGED